MPIASITIIGGIGLTAIGLAGQARGFASEGRAIGRGNGVPNSFLNAFEHAYASAELTRLYGSEFAELLGDLNELGSNSPASQQDQFNNSIGRQIGQYAEDNNIPSGSSAYDDLFQDAFNQGLLAGDPNNLPNGGVPLYPGPSSNAPGSSQGRAPEDDPGNPLGNALANGIAALFGKPPVSPLILDMDGDGIELVSLEDSQTFFDMTANSFAELTGWVQSDDALLAIDINGDGQINSINELFGNETTDGFVELATLDSNGDGVIDVNDTSFSDLLLWHDTNANGISESGELVDLTTVGIASIDLNYTSVNQTNAGHSISSISSFTRTDGTTDEIVDVWFDTQTTFSRFIHSDTFVYNTDVYTLPNLKGYGVVADLWTVMTQDTTLLQAVESFMAQDMTSMGFVDFRTDTESILVKWLGVENIDPNSRGAYVDGQHLEGLEAFTGQIFNNGIDPEGIQAAEIEALWDRLVDETAAKLLTYAYSKPLMDAAIEALEVIEGLQASGQFDTMTSSEVQALLDPIYNGAQTEVNTNPLTPIIANVGQYNEVTDSIEADFDILVDNIINNEPSDSNDKQEYWLEWLPFINAITRLSNITDSTYINALSGTFLDTLSQGSLLTLLDTDTIVGLFGDDTLTGIDFSDDTLIGANGNDILKGGKGNDTYIYNLGDGNDTIDDTGFSHDKLRFGAGITQSDLTFSQIGTTDDMLISLSDGSTITIIDQFYSDDGIETLYFDDGSNVTSEDILQLLAGGTSGDDVLYGNSSANTIDGGYGNDTIDAGWGNDKLTGGTGDDLLKGGAGHDWYYYYLGDGNDIIDDSGWSHDWLIFGENITQNDVTYTRMSDRDLQIDIVGGGSVYIVDQFYNDDMIEYLRFNNDGSTVTDDEIRDIILAADSTDGDDVIYGFDFMNDVIAGGLGDDTLMGGSGNDLYLYDLGDGNDIIDDSGWNYDVLDFGAGITQNDLTFSQISGTDDLLIDLSDGSTITIIDQFYNDDAIETLRFDDGSILTNNDIAALI